MYIDNMVKDSSRTKSTLLIIIPIFFCIIGVVAFEFASMINHPDIQVSSNDSALKKGLSFSPKDFTNEGVQDFLLKVKNCCKVLSWAGDISEVNNGNSGAVFATKTAPVNNLKSIIIFGFNDLPTPPAQAVILSSLISFVQQYKPDYLGIGNEINKNFNENNLRLFSQWFDTVYDQLKSVNQSTQIFTTFQYEALRGLNGGLFGGVNDEDNNQWNLLDSFSKADLIVFTSYPGLIYKSPEDIPTNYYNVIKDHTSKPFALSEIAWFRDPQIAGWESSQDEQFAFVQKIPDLLVNSNPSFVIWPFLYDPETVEPFKSMGLINPIDNDTRVFDLWSRL